MLIPRFELLTQLGRGNLILELMVIVVHSVYAYNDAGEFQMAISVRNGGKREVRIALEDMEPSIDCVFETIDLTTEEAREFANLILKTCEAVETNGE